MFFGTPAWAVPSLDALVASEAEVAAVVTKADRPAGRGMELHPSPVKSRALEAGIEVLQPEKARDPAIHERLAALAPDVAVVVAYGSILPASLLEVPRRGFVNVHFSLLPLYRGAAPVQRALMEGRSETGISIMVLTPGMDEGPLLAQSRVTVAESDTAGAIGERMASLGAELLVSCLDEYVAGRLTPEAQDDDAATYAPKITTEEARIDWNRPARGIRAHVRGLNPAPGAWTTIGGARLKVWAAEAIDRTDLAPAQVAADDGLVAGCSDGSLELTDVQLQGKRRMTGAELARGLRLSPDERLGREVPA